MNVHVRFFFERVYNVFWFLSEKVDSYVFARITKKSSLPVWIVSVHNLYTYVIHGEIFIVLFMFFLLRQCEPRFVPYVFSNVTPPDCIEKK